jgi:ATP-dependent helicase HrpB
LAQIAQNAAELRRRAAVDRDRQNDDPQAMGELLALAFPERVARQDPADPRRYQLANGRGARLRDDSRLLGSAWLVAAELRLEARDSLVQLAAPVDEPHLREADPQRFVRDTQVIFNPEARALEASISERFGAIVLSRQRIAVPRSERSTEQLLRGVRELGIAALPWTEALQQWRVRAVCLREWLPDAALPDLGDAALLANLADWLGAQLDGLTRLDALDAARLGDALHGLLDHRQRRLLDEHAPVAIDVPSGRRLALHYAIGAPPVLAVKLQEMFGAADTPRVARGRVPVTLHLLSPAQRPIQVTQDLRGFWQRTYPEVKKELKGRYPRHPWPDDPWVATATHRAKPRGT